MKLLSTIITCIISGLLLSGCSKTNDSSVKSWQTLAPMPTSRDNLGFAEAGGLLYAIGGYSGNGLNTVEAYNPVTNNWQTKASMPTARGYLVVASVGGKIFAIGGFSGGPNTLVYTNATEVYDPATDSWSTKTPCPIPEAYNSVLGNQFITGATIGNKIFVVVGSSTQQITLVYDPAADSWDSANSISEFAFQPYFSASNGSAMYLSDGTVFWHYSTSDNAWNALQQFPTLRSGACLAADSGHVYAIGGFIPNYNASKISASSEVDIYDLSSSSWSRAGQLNRSTQSAAALVYNSNLYIVGGAPEYDGGVGGSAHSTLSDLQVFPLH